MGMLGVYCELVWFLVAALPAVSPMGTSRLPHPIHAVVERYFISLIHGGEDRRHGAVEARRPMRGDGLAQEEVAVWRHGDADG